MRVLNMGASGMLGLKLLQVLSEEPSLDVHGTIRPGAGGSVAAHLHFLDLGAGSAALGEVLQRVQPDVVVNAVGAIKQLDLSRAVDDTFYMNGTLPHLIPLLSP